MREIKFRAWDTEREVMAKVSHIGLNDYEVGMEDEECRCWNAPYPYVCKLMQYTGLKDVEGNEIYEGDIIEKEFVDFSCRDNFKGVVKFIDGSLFVENEKKRTAYYLFSETDINCILGNIYENKELLEQ